jgi:hypothetical protein
MKTLENTTPKISILLPTRGRTEQLKRSINSLIDLANDPGNIEWCLGFDSDDRASFDYFSEHILPTIQSHGGKFICIEFAPLGYGKLNEYVNFLAKNSHAPWMVFWNDDAVMKTQDWDVTISSYGDQFCLQAFDTHNKHPYSIFPIVPRKWLELVGHLSLHPLNDAWLSQIAWMLDKVIRIPVEVDHERYDLTGKNFDDTFKNRIIYEGNMEDPRDFNHADFRTLRLKEAVVIANYLAQQGGYDLTHWYAMATGKVDPWTKMMASDVNNQMITLRS